MSNCDLKWLLIIVCIIIALIGLYLAFAREKRNIDKGSSDIQDGGGNLKDGSFNFKFAIGIVLIVIGIGGAYLSIKNLPGCEGGEPKPVPIVNDSIPKQNTNHDSILHPKDTVTHPNTSREKPQPPIKQLFNEQSNLRYEFKENGNYQLNLLNVKKGNVSEYTVCIEGSCTDIQNRCNKNFDISNWIVEARQGCSITVFKSEDGHASGETMIKSGASLKKNILIWQSDGGFTLEIEVRKIR